MGRKPCKRKEPTDAEKQIDELTELKKQKTITTLQKLELKKLKADVSLEKASAQIAKAKALEQAAPAMAGKKKQSPKKAGISQYFCSWISVQKCIHSFDALLGLDSKCVLLRVSSAVAEERESDADEEPAQDDVDEEQHEEGDGEDDDAVQESEVRASAMKVEDQVKYLKGLKRYFGSPNHQFASREAMFHQVLIDLHAKVRTVIAISFQLTPPAQPYCDTASCLRDLSHLIIRLCAAGCSPVNRMPF